MVIVFRFTVMHRMRYKYSSFDGVGLWAGRRTCIRTVRHCIPCCSRLPFGRRSLRKGLSAYFQLTREKQRRVAQSRRSAIRPAPSAAAVAGSSGETTSTSRSSSAESRTELLGESGDTHHPARRRDGAAEPGFDTVSCGRSRAQGGTRWRRRRPPRRCTGPRAPERRDPR